MKDAPPERALGPAQPPEAKDAGKMAKRPGIGVTFGGSASTKHEVALATDTTLPNIFGTADTEQATALLSQCLKALTPAEAGDGNNAADERYFLLSIINDMAPRDAIERMVAVQMAITHVATIRSARRLAQAQNLNQVEAHYTGFTKLTRTFTAQMEALRKHRTGGTQTVVVQHVNIADGGQAIVGNVQTGGRG